MATEFPTGQQHAGRIDTLALSEDGNPVVIEYKKVESSELINQSLYYLSWLNDHRGDFQVAASRALGSVEIDWSEIRVICIAPGYKKYDLHAVQVMGANIELWQYRLFQNSTLYLEEVFRRSTVLAPTVVADEKDPVMVAAGKKAAASRATGVYKFEDHLTGTTPAIADLVQDLREYIQGLDESVEETPKKYYIAYKIAQNFVCMEVQKNKVVLFLKVDPSEVAPLPTNARDVTDIGHFGTGDLELAIKTKSEVEAAKPFIEMAFERVGG